MKKNLISLGVVLAAIFTLTNCSKESQSPAGDTNSPYILYANTTDTKTINDGMSTKWRANDAISAFHAPAGTSDFSANSKFTIEEVETGRFTATELSGTLAEYNDWHVQYPYMSTATLDAPYYLNLGYAQNQTLQVQTGNDSKAHIAGQYYPLFGIAKDVPRDELPNISMKNLMSLVEVVVTNSTSEDLLVTTVSLTAEEELVGRFAIDFCSEIPSFNALEENSSKTAALSVSKADPIIPGGSAKFYIAVKPFTAIAGQTLTLSVNGTGKALVMKTDVTFSSGRIKTLKYNYKQDNTPQPVTIKEILGYEAGKYAYTDGIVVATYRNGFILEDETGSVLVYEGKTPSAEIGDEVSVIGTTSVFDSFVQIQTPAVTILGKGNEVVYPNVDELTGQQLDALAEATYASYVEFTGKLLPFNNYYYRVVVDGATIDAIPAYTPDSFGLSGMAGGKVKICGYVVGRRTLVSGETQLPGVTIMVTSATLLEQAVIEATAAEIIAAGEGGMYQMTGYISTVKSWTYGNYNLDDYSGSIYIYGTLNASGQSKKFEEMGINAGDILTVKGPKIIYNGVHELNNVSVVNHWPVTSIDIWDFCNHTDDDPQVYYRLTGKVTEIAMDPDNPSEVDPHGNFYLKEDYDKVYVNGLVRGLGAPENEFQSMAIRNGDKVTIVGVRATDDNGPVVRSAFLIAHEPAPTAGTEDFTKDDNIIEW